MRKRKFRVAIVLLVLTIIAAFSSLVYLLIPSPEPVYHGKKLRAWLAAYADYPWSDIHGSYAATSIREANEAVKALGTNCLPTLLQLLAARDSALKLKFAALMAKQHVITFQVVPAEVLHREAALAIAVLGAKASNAIPALLRVWEQYDSAPTMYCMARALAAMGPIAEPAIPVMLKGLNHTNETARVYAADVLGAIHAQPALVIPALVKTFNDPNPHVRGQAASAVGEFGQTAKSSLPALLYLMNDPNPEVRASAYSASRQIDERAADSAGAK